MAEKFYVYVITDPRDSQPFYVGKGCGDRMMNHEWATRRNSSDSYLPHHDRIRELIALGLTPEYSQPFVNQSEQDALIREKVLIEFYGRQNIGTGILLNQSEGGKNSGTSPKAVVQYDLDGNFIADFPSAKDAGEATTANGSYIVQCCKGKRRSSGGYLWSYKGEPAPVFTKAKFNPVTQFDLEGNVIQKYKSLTDAQNATGIERHNISEACRGKSQTAGGFKWAYSSKVP